MIHRDMLTLKQSTKRSMALLRSLAVFLLATACTRQLFAAAVPNPEDFVNLLAGSFTDGDRFSTGNTLPLVGRPWGFNHWSPQTKAGREVYAYGAEFVSGGSLPGFVSSSSSSPRFNCLHALCAVLCCVVLLCCVLF